MQTISIRRELWGFQDPLVGTAVIKSVAASFSAFKYLPAPVLYQLETAFDIGTTSVSQTSENGLGRVRQ